MKHTEIVASRDKALTLARSALTDKPLVPADEAIVAALLALYYQNELQHWSV